MDANNVPRCGVALIIAKAEGDERNKGEELLVNCSIDNRICAVAYRTHAPSMSLLRYQRESNSPGPEISVREHRCSFKTHCRMWHTHVHDRTRDNRISQSDCLNISLIFDRSQETELCQNHPVRPATPDQFTGFFVHTIPKCHGNSEVL